jgi:hypothetical protein
MKWLGENNMKPIWIIKFMALVISILFVLLPGVSLAEAISQANQPRPDNSMQPIEEPSNKLPSYIPVNLNMKENNRLSPEMPEPGSTSSSVVCPNGFTPAWWSIRKNRGSTEWRDVGTWETITVGKALQATGLVRFRVWMTFLGSGNPGTSEFQFTWLRNEDTIASTTIDVELNEEPRLVDAQASLINQTPFEPGDVFKLFIRCRISLDGARILYGSLQHNTHIQMTCDPFDIYEVSACDHGIKGLYADVFRVKHMSMTFYGKVDQLLIIEPPQYGLETIDNTNLVSVHWEQKLEDGTHEIEFGISYVPNDNTSVVSLIQSVKIEPKKIPSFLGIPLEIWNYVIYIVVFVIIIASVVMIYNRHQEKKWLAEFENEEL